jgi:hypothetical protein
MRGRSNRNTVGGQVGYVRGVQSKETKNETKIRFDIGSTGINDSTGNSGGNE